MIEKNIRNTCFKKAHQLYGENLPLIIEARLEKELDIIIAGGYAEFFVALSKLVRKSTLEGYRAVPRGSIGAFLTAMLSGITETNPLKPHYRCPNCYYTEFDSDEVNAHSGGAGADLPDKNCPVCGTSLEKDGFDIPHETFMGPEGERAPSVELNFPCEYLEKALESVEAIFGSDRIFCDKNESCVYRVFIFPTGKTAKQVDEFSMDDDVIHINFIGHKSLTLLRALEEQTGLKADRIRLDAPSVMDLFKGTTASDNLREEILQSLKSLGIPLFCDDIAGWPISELKPKCFSDLIRIEGLCHGTGAWEENAEILVEDGVATLSDCICTRDDILNYLVRQGMESSMAYDIMEEVRKGKVECGRAKRWTEWAQTMKTCGVPDWYIKSCEKIQYLFPKAHAAAYVMMNWRIAYYMLYYPEAFNTALLSMQEYGF
ncbi:MAG: hypothetical protein IKF90_08885 [Parasporobacterium sp.]|nr:hypothetical protein [Parasporobacterium sp.]